jgi:predicted CoA-binding protein
MQEGIYNEEAERMARAKGIEVVYNRCMMAEHMRLFRNSD